MSITIFKCLNIMFFVSFFFGFTNIAFEYLNQRGAMLRGGEMLRMWGLGALRRWGRHSLDLPFLREKKLSIFLQ